VVLITTAPVSYDEEYRRRVRRYSITMGTRTVLFLLSVFLLPGAWKAVGIIASLIMPWVAVVAANAAPPRRKEKAPSLYRPDGPRDLPGGGRTIG
jgi:hypothetical protein